MQMLQEASQKVKQGNSGYALCLQSRPTLTILGCTHRGSILTHADSGVDQVQKPDSNRAPAQKGAAEE